MYHVLLFTDFVQDPEVRYSIGYLFIFFTAIFISVCCCFACFVVCRVNHRAGVFFPYLSTAFWFVNLKLPPLSCSFSSKLLLTFTFSCCCYFRRNYDDVRLWNTTITRFFRSKWPLPPGSRKNGRNLPENLKVRLQNHLCGLLLSK